MTDWSTPRVSPVQLRHRETWRERILERDSPLRRLDWILVAAATSLGVIGAVLVWSATRPRLEAADGDPQAYLKRHCLNLLIGLALGAVAALVDYRMLRAYAPIVYAASCLGLVAVLIPGVGSVINGSQSWIEVGGGFQIQPSEFAKVALVVGMAMILGEKRDGEDDPRDSDVLLVLALAAVPMLLIFLQPDFGTMMVFVFTILGVIAVSGAPARWVAGLVTLGVAAGWAILHFDMLKDYQVERFTSFANPTANLGTAGYNVNQARIAIGSGGFRGSGLFKGTQTTGQFVPEQQTDFVFTVAGEELGFVGAGLVLLLLAIVLWRGIQIAANAGDAFGTLVASGVVSWFAFQSFVNIGMTLGIMPVTGLPLPFVSYGGSSMFATMIAIGLLCNVHMRSREWD
ncbi:MAG TPA: rod shape-determining protein RodA [Mycobacteriales bacterium]|nr:rod shape-determining protein RodA [Mycobacteriales bacterium]